MLFVVDGNYWNIVCRVVILNVNFILVVVEVECEY